MGDNSTRYKKIEVVPYNPHWIEQYEKEANSIKTCLQDNLLTIHHIGSTSIPGLSSKPKIDIIAEVVDPKKAIEALATIGIQYRGEYNIPFHYGFSKRGVVDVNLHVYEENNPEVELNLLFKNYLINHPDAKAAYQKLKEEIIADESAHIVKENAQFVSYTLRKGSFIKNILKKAGFDRVRMLRCSDDHEWTIAQKLREEFFRDKGFTKDPYASSLHSKNHEHFILYKGAVIIVYAHIELGSDHRATLHMMLITEAYKDRNHQEVFMQLIEKWLKMQGYQIVHT